MTEVCSTGVTEQKIAIIKINDIIKYAKVKKYLKFVTLEITSNTASQISVLLPFCDCECNPFPFISHC